jgi:hypothetical protein
VYLNAERRNKGKYTPWAWEAIYLGLTPKKSLWLFYFPERNSIYTTNQAKFDEHVFPFCKASVIDTYLMDNATYILYQHPNNIKWMLYNAKHATNYKEVHHNKIRGISTFQVLTAEKTSNCGLRHST